MDAPDAHALIEVVPAPRRFEGAIVLVPVPITEVAIAAAIRAFRDGEAGDDAALRHSFAARLVRHQFVYPEVRHP